MKRSVWRGPGIGNQFSPAPDDAFLGVLSADDDFQHLQRRSSSDGPKVNTISSTKMQAMKNSMPGVVARLRWTDAELIRAQRRGGKRRRGRYRGDWPDWSGAAGVGVGNDLMHVTGLGGVTVRAD